MPDSQKSLTPDFLSEEIIHEQLRKIFNCSVFSVSDILRRFLTYIIQETLAGRSNTIKEYTIAVSVLNKPSSFKPQQDAIVRIHAGRLRRALHYYYKESDDDDKIEISIPKGSYIPMFERIQNGAPVKIHNPAVPREIPEKITLVVLPFMTLETETARLAFTDSLGRQLSAGLAKFPDFSVASYHTTRKLSSRKKEIRELVAVFGAQFVVTGDVQFENRNLRVSIQLTNTQTGTQIWTEQYHNNAVYSGLFATEDDLIFRMIADLGDFNGQIVQQISRGQIKNKAGHPFSTILSHYHDFYFGFNETGFKNAYACMESVVDLDPFNDVAWSLLSQLSVISVLFNHTTKENPLVLGLRYARRALKLNPVGQHGFIALGMAQIFLDNKQAGLEALETARMLNPSATGLMGIIGCLMITAGEYERGLLLLNDSMKMNKNFPSVFYVFIGLCHFKKCEYATALLFLDKTGMSEEPLNILLRISILAQMGRKPDAEILAKSAKGYALNKGWISREYISRFLLDTELIDQINQGFKSIPPTFLTVA
jgi:adenylate cyclase